MANPRKFSEKIALHTTRQAEETAAFDKIMKEVLAVTSKDDPGEHQQNAQPPGGGSPVGAGTGAPGQYRPGARARSPVGPIRRPHDRRQDTSPYGPGPYLSPPADTSWRRTNSDSALHHSAMQGVGMDRGDPSNRGSWSMLPMNGPDRNHHDGRSRSSRDLPRVPGIYIHHSAPIPNQIPIGNNTGSLPDLTNMDFTSPIHMPLDQDQDNSSPYSSNHLSVPVNSRYPHRHMRQSVDNKNIIQDGTSEYTQLGSMTGHYQQQQCPPTSPSPTLQHQAGYRSPHRPSPQSSPGLGGRHSAPCSPGGGGGPSSPLSTDYQLFNQHPATTQFHQHFEQLSMLDTPVSSAPIPFADPAPASAQPVGPHSLPDASTLAGLGLEAERYTYGQSQPPPAYPGQQSPGLQQAPNTPPSVPEIVLTDFSADDVTRHDLEQQLEHDLFGATTEEALREGLGSLDFDDFEILNTHLLGSVVPESVEERFRMERS